MRVNVQLIDAETGSHLWAERFDKPVADLFEMQDEIVARLAGQLGAELIAAEARRAESAPNPDLMDLFFQGRAFLIAAKYPTCWRRHANSINGRSNWIPTMLKPSSIPRAWTYVAARPIMTDDPRSFGAAAEAKLAKAIAMAPNSPRLLTPDGPVLLCGPIERQRCHRGITTGGRA